jgi:hypothetical protein
LNKVNSLTGYATKSKLHHEIDKLRKLCYTQIIERYKYSEAPDAFGSGKSTLFFL